MSRALTHDLDLQAAECYQHKTTAKLELPLFPIPYSLQALAATRLADPPV